MTSDELVLAIVNMVDDYRSKIHELEKENDWLTRVAVEFATEYRMSWDEMKSIYSKNDFYGDENE